MFPILAMNYTKYPQACKALIAFMLEADNFNKWMQSAQGYLSHCLSAYDAQSGMDGGSQTTPYRDVAKRSLTGGGSGRWVKKRRPAISTSSSSTWFAELRHSARTSKARSRLPSVRHSVSIADHETESGRRKSPLPVFRL